jgi:N-ethylmaleimide reductase
LNKEPTMANTAETSKDLFAPFQLGDITLANRMVMAPLTRSRALAGNVPGPLTVEYYTQRASIGLIIAEATQVSATAQGSPRLASTRRSKLRAGAR